jgi:imidazolonepropionase-like amidohydrolase
LTVKPWIESLPQGIVFTNALVVDPATSTLLEGLQTVVVKDGKIESIRRGESDTSKDRYGFQIVDLKGTYICPYVPSISVRIAVAIS